MLPSSSSLRMLLGLFLAWAALLSSSQAADLRASIAWVSIPGSSGYEYEIATDPSMKNVIDRKRTRQTKLDLKLSPGNYYYRVRGVDPTGAPGLWGDVQLISLSPSPPRLLSPANRQIFDRRLPKSGIHLTWEEGPARFQYILQISDREGDVVEEKLREPEYFWLPDEPGEYFWRVGYQGIDDVEWGERRRIIIRSGAFPKPVVAAAPMPKPRAPAKPAPQKPGAQRPAAMPPSTPVTQAPTPPLAAASAPKKRAPRPSPVTHPNAIAGLNWMISRFYVYTDQESDELRVLANLEGEFQRPGWTLLSDKTTIPVSAAGKFRFLAPLSGPSVSLKMIALGPNGEVEKETVQFTFAEQWERHKAAYEAWVQKRFSYSIGLAVTALSYRETNRENFAETALTPKMNFIYRLIPKRWDMSGSVYFTALPVSKSRPVDLRFLGVNFRTGYVLPFIHSPWRLTLFGGVYYTTTFASGEAIGFQNIMGPQLYPALTHRLKGNSELSFYFKVSPVTDQFRSFSMQSRELAAGMSFFRPSGQYRGFFLSLDAAQLQIQLSRFKSVTSSGSLGAGYQF